MARSMADSPELPRLSTRSNTDEARRKPGRKAAGVFSVSATIGHRPDRQQESPDAVNDIKSLVHWAIDCRRPSFDHHQRVGRQSVGEPAGRIVIRGARLGRGVVCESQLSGLYCYALTKCGEHGERSSDGRALGCGPSGRGFKSRRSPLGSPRVWRNGRRA